jgi:hypothetical protein
LKLEAKAEGLNTHDAEKETDEKDYKDGDSQNGRKRVGIHHGVYIQNLFYY